MKLKLKDKTISIPAGTELHQVLTAIMSNADRPKTVGALRMRLEQYEQERVAILKRLAGSK